VLAGRLSTHHKVFAYYLDLADVAEREGMQAVIDASTQALIRHVSGLSKPEDWDYSRGWVAECIGSNPANRERFLSTDPQLFAATMRKWSAWELSPGLYRMHLSDEELARITVPALIVPGLDALHPEETARSLAALLPNAHLADFSEHYTAAEVQAVVEAPLPSQKAFLHAAIIEAFLQQHEGVYQGPIQTLLSPAATTPPVSSR
jgi:pimeloyl-ACP methyl ester carboxylesterase